MPATDSLPRRVRIGYGSGSVATGAFGTVPGLMLLPYLTDSLGIAALAAGFIVFLPKAWDVVLNPIAGRISDRTVDPRGPRRPWLLRAGLPLAACFALLFAAPEMATGLEALWVLVLFLGCATAYAFFQVPYVAMPAEITASYDERTRLMTWRVAILAFTIMLAGATAPAIRDAVGGRAAARGRQPARAAAHRRRGARLPVAAHHVRRPGPRRRLHARRRRLPGLRRPRQGRRRDDPLRLLRRPGPAADPGLDRDRHPDRQEAGLPGQLALPRRRRDRRGHRPVRATGRRLPRRGPDRGRVRRLPGLPDGDAPRRRRRRRPAHRLQPCRGLHRRLDRGRDSRPRPRPGGLRPGAGAGRLPVVHRRRRRPARL